MELLTAAPARDLVNSVLQSAGGVDIGVPVVAR